MSERHAYDRAAPATAKQQSRPLRGWGSLVILVLRLTLAGGLAVAGWAIVQLQPWATLPASASQPRSTIPWTNVNPIGVNTFLSSEVEAWKRERTMEMVAESGAGWIRQGFAWNEIEPQKGEHWDAKYQQDAWAKFDEIVALAEQHGIRIIARLDQTPHWARPGGTDPATPPTDPEDFGDFVYEFVSRYKGRISFIQIWNEPNLAQEWGGAIDPAGYARLLSVAAKRAREANPDIVILSAPMAMTTENSGRAADELSYWQALYDHGVADSFDIMSANAYGLGDRYDAAPSLDRLNMRRVELLREVAERNGDGHKAIWFNEYGWNAAPEDFDDEQLIWGRVDDAQQAEWTAEGIAWAREHWEWFGMANIWYFRQVGEIPMDRADYYFRMVDLEFTPRDVYRSVQRLSTELNVAGPGWHGVLEAPVSPRGSWNIVRHEEFPDGYAIQGEAGDTLWIRFSGSSLDLHLDPAASTGSISVTIHDGTQGTERGSRPHQFVLDGADSILRISDGILEHPSSSAPHSRTAVITVNDGSTLTLTGFNVAYERSYGTLIAGGGLAGVALAGLVVLRRQTAARQ